MIESYISRSFHTVCTVFAEWVIHSTLTIEFRLFGQRVVLASSFSLLSGPVLFVICIATQIVHANGFCALFCLLSGHRRQLKVNFIHTRPDHGDDGPSVTW